MASLLVANRLPCSRPTFRRPHRLSVGALTLLCPAINLAAHAADQAVIGQQRLMYGAGVLAAAIRMYDQARCRLALHDGQLCSARHTSPACISGAIAQPTTLRANKSSTTA
jgi:hypothetical protein